jgi:hypothetical protein
MVITKGAIFGAFWERRLLKGETIGPNSQKVSYNICKFVQGDQTGKGVMKRVFFLLIFLLSLLGMAEAKNYEASKKAGEYQVEIVIDRNPLVAIGDNNMEILIKDNDGKPVTDAQVIVNYYMPPMPRMAPMSYKTEAKMKKGKYYATMKFIMAGPWYIAIVIHRGGKTSTTKINVDAQ